MRESASVKRILRGVTVPSLAFVLTACTGDLGNSTDNASSGPVAAGGGGASSGSVTTTGQTQGGGGSGSYPTNHCLPSRMPDHCSR